MQNLKDFKKVLSSPKSIVITTHHKPDADALGASLGLATYLVQKGHAVKVISPTDYPRFLHWMRGNEDVIIYNEGNEKISEKYIQDADLIFCLDFSALNRINELGKLVGESEAQKILIDHHHGKENFADFEFWNPEAAATCELVYQLIDELGETNLIDADTADSLYAGITTDTGSFKHPNTSKHVHLVVAALIDLGADVAKVSKLVYDNNSIDRLKFIGYALSNKLIVLPEYSTAYFAISAEELRQFNSQTGDTEGLVNYALSIEGITLAAVIIDRKDGVKISFRSIGLFSVNDFSSKHFEGGGHKNAAGGKSELSLEDTVHKFLNLLPYYKEELNNKQEIKKGIYV